MIDIHAHLIYGVDDGCKDIEQAVTLAKNEVANGVTNVVCTPHFKKHQIEPDYQECKEKLDILQRRLEQEKIDLKLHLGWELKHSEKYVNANQYKLRRIMCHKKIVLLELDEQEQDVLDACYGYMVHGYKVILAHVERLRLPIEEYEDLKNEGAFLQVNANAFKFSLFGENRIVRKLLKRRLIDFVSSDTHVGRKNYMKKAYEKTCKVAGKEYAEQIFNDNAKRLFNI